MTTASFRLFHTSASAPAAILGVCAFKSRVNPAALRTKSPSLLSEGENTKRRQCPPALLSTMRKGAPPASGKPNMDTTLRAEGSSLPTTKGTDPPGRYYVSDCGDRMGQLMAGEVQYGCSFVLTREIVCFYL